MKHTKIIILTAILSIFYACENNKEPYMTFTTKAKQGEKICLKVLCPQGEKVGIDWNNNKNLEEFEKLSMEENALANINNDGYVVDIYNDGYYVEKTITVQSSEFTVYGAVTFLYCPESEITAIDISHNPHLEILFCQDNALTNLDISKNKNLKLLFCANNSDMSNSESQNSFTDLDISNNPKLDYLALPRSIKTNIFDLEFGYRELEKTLKQQNLWPENYYIFELAESGSSDNNDDKLILFEKNIAYADRKEYENVDKKLIYFKSLGNNKYEIKGEADNIFSGLQDVSFKDENHITDRVWESMEDYTDYIYQVKNGKIVKK